MSGSVARATRAWGADAAFLAAALGLLGCGSRTSLELLFQDDGSSPEGAGGAVGSGGRAATTGGAVGSGGQTTELRHAPDPVLDPPEFCTLDGWCGANADFVAISGTSETDIWILANDTGDVGQALAPFDPNAPQRSAILHWDGVAWTIAQPPPDVLPPGALLRGISAGTPDDVWIVGDAARLLKLEDGMWTGGAEGVQPTSVSALPSGTTWFGYTVPDFFLITKDGQMMSPVVSSALGITSLWGDELGVWLVGPELVARHQTFEFSMPNTNQLTTIWGADPKHAVAAGPAGVIAQLEESDGQIFQTILTLGDMDFRSVWGSAIDDVWVVGTSGSVVRYDGQYWASSNQAEETLNGVWGHAGRVWAVGDAGTFLALEEDTWQSSRPTTKSLRVIWGAAADDVWAAGEQLTHWDGQTWTTSGVAGTTEILALSGTSPSDVWAVGREGMRAHWDGKHWKNSPPSTSAAVTGVWAQAPDRVWAVSEAGDYFFYDGDGWSGSLPEGAPALSGICGNSGGDLVVVGAAGRSVFQGGVGADYPGSEPGAIYTLVFGDGEYVWTAGYVPWSAYKAGGTYPELGRWEGGAFIDNLEPQEPFPLPHNPIQAGWGRGKDNVWIALPHVMHWDGATWATSSIGGAERVQALFGIEDDLWAITERSVIVHRELP